MKDRRFFFLSFLFPQIVIKISVDFKAKKKNVLDDFIGGILLCSKMFLSWNIFFNKKCSHNFTTCCESKKKSPSRVATLPSLCIIFEISCTVHATTVQFCTVFFVGLCTTYGTSSFPISRRKEGKQRDKR